MTTVLQSDVTQPLSESEFVASLRRFTVAEYQRMIAAGISPSGERVELLEGWIVWKDGYAPPADDLTAWVTPDDSLPSLASLRRFTVDEYHRLIAEGILVEGERVELLHGWIVQKMGQNPPHSQSLRKLMRLFERLVDERWIVSPQLPVLLTGSEPEPDLAIVRGPEARYDARHPEAADVALIVEVADSTLRSDRTLKAHLYAEAGVPAYWLVNVVDGVVECHSNPIGGATPAYRNCVVRTREDRIPVVLDGVAYGELAVKDFLS